MVKPVLASRRSIGFIGEGVRTANQWWLSGGISAANCVAAYQPKGAASYAASKTNLANPGTYDATDGTAYPTWDATNGWKSNGTQYLRTGIFPTNDYSAIVRFSNVTSSDGVFVLFGSQNVTSLDRFLIMPKFTSNAGVRYGFGTGVNVTPSLTSGVLAIAKQAGYRNGSSDATLGTISTFMPKILIFQYNQDTTTGEYLGNNGNGLAAYIQAFAIYSTTISASQVAALTTAMNAI